MKLTSGIICFLCGVVAIEMLGCSSGDLAGGTGVGNPITEVALSMHVLEKDSITAALLKKRPSGSTANSGAGVTISDNSDNTFSVTSARITVARLKFFSETEETPWIEGPFMFDAITGESEPSLVSFDAPSGSYTGIKLLVTKKGNNSTEEPAIEVSGTFDYNNESHAFSIDLKCNLSVGFTLDNGTLELRPDAEMDLDVVLDADQWLEGTTIIDCVTTGKIALQEDGSLLIDETIPPGPCHSNENTIRHNILDSGKLIANF